MKATTYYTVNVIAKADQAFLIGLVLLFGLVVAGCQSVHSEQFKPALLDASSEASQVQIKQIIANELGVQELKIATNAFVEESWIVITKQAQQTLENQNIQGRDMQIPKRFKLMKSGSNCYLLLDSHSKSWKLTGVSCRYQ